MTHTKNISQAVFDAAWDGFAGTDWRDKSSVARFVQANYTPYDGDSSFLAPATERTLDIKRQIETARADYEKNGFPMDTDRATSIAGIGAGYIDRDKELIVGIQNDELFKRRMAGQPAYTEQPGLRQGKRRHQPDDSGRT